MASPCLASKYDETSVRLAENHGLFPDGIVPYVVEHSRNNIGPHITVIQAIYNIEKQTCLSFVAPIQNPREHNTTIKITFTEFSNGSRAFAISPPNTIHEFAHVYVSPLDGLRTITARLLNAIAGLQYEHERMDRDNYVRINWDNIREGQEWEFQKTPNYPPKLSYFEKYAYNSIMSVGWYYQSKNGKPTIEPLKGTLKDYPHDMEIDMKRINSLYRQLVRRSYNKGKVFVEGPIGCE